MNTSKIDNDVDGNDLSASYSSRELHDKSHFTSWSTKFLSKLLDSTLLQRAQAGYLFDCKLNKKVVKDDHWLKDVWDWIEGKIDVRLHVIWGLTII